MKRQLIKSVTPRDYNNALLNLQALCDKDLNIEYNYAGLYSNMYTLAYYYNELARLLGAELSLRFSYTITHSSPVRICLTKDMSNLKDINAPLRISTMELEGFVSLLYGTYTELFNEYSEAVSDANAELSGSTDVYNEMVEEYNDLLQQAVNAENVTQQDLAEALRDADEATREEAQATNTEASTPPEGTIGSGITNTSTSEEQDRGRQAAEDYAKDVAKQNEINDLYEAATKANEASEKAYEAWEESRLATQEAKDAVTAAEAAQTAAQSAAQGASAATVMSSNGTLPSNPGESQTVTTSSGTTTVTMNDDGTYTVTHINSDGTGSTTRTYDDASAFDKGGGSTSPAQRSTAEEAAQAQVAKAEAQNEYNQAKAAQEAAKDEYFTKTEEAEQATKAWNDATNEDSIPTATPDELDSWDNSGGSTEGVAETSEDIINDFDFGEDTEDDNE